MQQAASIDAAPRPAPARRLATALRRFNGPGLVTIAVLLFAWQLASRTLPPFLFPPIQDVLRAVSNLLADPSYFLTSLHTYVRIALAVAVTFVIAVSAGVAAALWKNTDRALAPILALLQGVPAICWTIFAILWFTQNELRIAFIVFVSTAPNFYFQSRNAVRSISHELIDMVRAWRPSTRQIVAKLIVPALTPILLTTTLVNLGMAVKVGVTAELLASASGIGNELRAAQELFRMDQAIAWTVPLVLFVLIIELASRYLDRTLLRWRPRPEHAA